MIDISSVDNRTAEQEDLSKERVKHLVDAWSNRSSELKNDIDHLRLVEKTRARLSNDFRPDPNFLHRKSSAHSDVEGRITSSTRRPGFFRQTNVLIARAHKNVYRNFAQLGGLIVQGIILGVIIGATYYQLPEVSLFQQVSGREVHRDLC